MNSHRIFAASATLLALGLTACHHRQVVAYTPPPAPAYGTASAARPLPNTTPPRIAAAPPPLGTQPPAPVDRALSTETGTASWYGAPYNHRQSADGHIYDQNEMTAAHRTLPLGTLVRVTNLTTGQSANVRITDRGPFVPGRIIDLSLAAAKATGLYRMGIGRVRVDVYSLPDHVDLAGRWCVQVGAFSTEAEALQLQHDLLRRYTTAKVIEFPGPTGHWVRITPAQPDEIHARQVADNIHPRDPASVPYLVRTN